MSVINTNSLSLIAQGNLTKSQNALGTAIERLSSGLRINSAKDDAAGQAIANRFTSNIKGLTQAGRNANDGISIAQTTEGALNEINNNLQRVRELTVQAANGSNSQSDLDSIQSEIQQRLDEIDRVSAQTQFNGTNVLAKDTSLKIQVGANDGETISIDLKEITAKTLGLDGFNVNGSGVTQNRKATVTDIQAANGATSGADWTVTTSHKALTAEQAFDQLKTGDTVVLDTTTAAGGETTYTFDAVSNSFTFTDTTVTATGANTGAADTAFRGLDSFKEVADSLKPSTGTKTATYEFGAGNVATFEIDAAGKLTIGGAAAYLGTDGTLSTNDASGSASQATIEDVLAHVASTTGAAGQPKLTVDGTDYTGATGGTATNRVLSFENSVSKDALLNEFVTTSAATSASDSAINLKSGLLEATVSFNSAEGGKEAANTYVDGDGELTTVDEYTTTYSVDADTGEVSVKANDDAKVAGTKYEAAIGAAVYINSAGKLTTETTSKGEQTEDPLAALDAALSQVDGLRSDLGAIQNRFESTITNLNNTITNLSSARSRIEDADYAVEVSNMTRAQILQQAGTSVLAQANQVPQGVLSLLG